MKEKEKELLLQYYYNKDLRLQDDIVTYENRPAPQKREAQ